ncbi:MAG: hypothetical protein H7Y06_13380 [Opitutaceae bacterium]|nr:hypothetical protein [Opitutaceae bacterium]
MKYLIPLFLLLVTARGIEHQESQVLAPKDLGIIKTIYTSQPGNVLVSSVTVERNGVVESDVCGAQADAEKNELIYFTGTPPWSKGPIFQLGRLIYAYDGYAVVNSTRGDGAGSHVFVYQLKHAQKEDLKLTVRIRELSYASAKAEFPDLPAPPILQSEVSSWWNRFDRKK